MQFAARIERRCPASYVRCERQFSVATSDGVYAYVIRYFMIQEKPTTAKLMILQPAFGSAVLVAKSYEDSAIPAEVKYQTELSIKNMTATLDNSPDLLGHYLDLCKDFVTQKYSRDIEDGGRYWGNSITH